MRTSSPRLGLLKVLRDVGKIRSNRNVLDEVCKRLLAGVRKAENIVDIDLKITQAVL